MNSIVANPMGLNFIVQEMQKQLYSELFPLWNNILNGYGLTQYISEQGITTPQTFVKNNDYSGNLITTDTSKFFFTKPNKSEHLGKSMFTTALNLFFIVNLKEAKPSVLHRADSEVQADVIKALEYVPLESLADVVDNPDVILREFKGLGKTNVLDNMQPHHIFKIGIEVMYNSKQQC